MTNANSYNIKQNVSLVILKNQVSEQSKLVLNLYKALLKLSTLLWYSAIQISLTHWHKQVAVQ